MRMIRTLLLALAIVAPWSMLSYPADRVHSGRSFLHAGETAEKDVHTPLSPSDRSALYRVAGVILFIWSGIALFLFILDRRVSRLEREMKSINRSREEGR